MYPEGLLKMPMWRPSLAVKPLQFFDLNSFPPRSPENFSLRFTFFKPWFQELLRVNRINRAKGQRWSQPGTSALLLWEQHSVNQLKAKCR